MAKIEVDGKSYRVTEHLGYMHGAGITKVVRTPEGARTAVKRGTRWVWLSPVVYPTTSYHCEWEQTTLYRNDSNLTYDMENESDDKENEQ